MNEKYNYINSMMEDIRDYIAENVNVSEYVQDFGEDAREELESKLYDDLWICDSVTGNASGSYYCNAYRAAEAIAHNMDLLADALESFGAEAEEYRRAITSPEYADVTIRCYCLGEAICAVLDEMEESGAFDIVEDDDSEEYEEDTNRAEIMTA